MPAFHDELGPEDIAKLASWVVWMRTGTAKDLKQLEE
jgi:mono/diheme cytochrome c family protein